MAQTDSIIRESVFYIAEESSFNVAPSGLSFLRTVFMQGSYLATGWKQDLWGNEDESQVRYQNPQRVYATQKDSKFGPLKMQWKGIPSSAYLNEGATPTPLSQMLMLKHGFGGGYAAAGCVVGTGSTTSSIVVDSTANRLAGEMVLIELTPSTGNFVPATVASVVDGTHFTLAEALPSAPTSTCGVRAMYTFYQPEVRSRTLCIQQKLTSTTGEEFRASGCFGDLKMSFPDWTKIPTWELSGGTVNWTGPTTLTSPAFGTATPAADDMGLPLLWQPYIWLASSINRASGAPYRIEKFALEFMSEWDMIPDGSQPSTVGGVLDLAGRSSDVAAKGSITIRMDPSEATNFTAGTIRSALIQCNGPTYVNSMAVLRIGQMYITSYPKPVSLGKGRTGMSFDFEVLRNTLTPTSTSVQQDIDLAYSPVTYAVG